MRILVCGDRNWTNYISIVEVISTLPKDSIIIHGCARGADTLAGIIAKNWKLKVLEFPAKWKEFGKRAGVFRNQQMIDDGKPDLILAFHNDIENSKGTKDMLKRGKKHGIKCILYSENNPLREI